MGASMRYHDLYSGSDGESHWRPVEVTLEVRSFAPPAESIEISDTVAATGAVFLRLRAGWNGPAHPTPVAQTLVCTRGRVIVTASDGETREIGPGDIWKMQDTGGKGHHTRVLGNEDFECVIIQHG